MTTNEGDGADMSATDPLRKALERLANPTHAVHSEEATLIQEEVVQIAREALAAVPAEPEAICNRCHAPKGRQAIGEGCNNNCGGRVVANLAAEPEAWEWRVVSRLGITTRPTPIEVNAVPWSFAWPEAAESVNARFPSEGTT